MASDFDVTDHSGVVNVVRWWRSLHPDQRPAWVTVRPEELCEMHDLAHGKPHREIPGQQKLFY